MIQRSNYRIAIVGLGYVGLPLAVEFARFFNVTGFDINRKRIQELSSGIDHTLEVEPDKLKQILKACPCDEKPGGGGLFCI